MSISRYPLWRYSLFQVPLGGFILCLIIALLSFLLGWGRPSLAMAIALDLSGSTYPQGSTLFVPGSVSAAEVEAVQEYLDLSSTELKVPNEIWVFGFGDTVQPLINDFSTNTARISQDLEKQLLRGDILAKEVGDGTNLGLAITEGVKKLQTFDDRCRELLLVTDGAVEIDPAAISQAVLAKVKIHSIVVGNESPALAATSTTSRGVYIGSATPNELKRLFREDVFTNLNSNLRWIIFWLGMAWICLMWTLVLPLDRWIFQGFRGLPMDLSGKFSLLNALFWSAATPGILWRITGGLAFLFSC